MNVSHTTWLQGAWGSFVLSRLVDGQATNAHAHIHVHHPSTPRSRQ
jgi:hypothetical protein